MHKKVFSVVAVSFLGISSLATANDTTTQAPAADNAAVNAERESMGLKNAADAGQKENEVKLAASIRQAIVDQKNLSTYAKNVKIVVNGNEVRLAGPVRSSAEKREVERIARAEAGTASVVSELKVAPVKK